MCGLRRAYNGKEEGEENKTESGAELARLIH
jgi:hypothetical protein